MLTQVLQKSHKAAEERHLALLELIHSDICEMNGVLTKGGQRYCNTPCYGLLNFLH
jgi:hypothetical protein